MPHSKRTKVLTELDKGLDSKWLKPKLIRLLEKMQTSAQTNFDIASTEVSSDSPYVKVYKTISRDHGYTAKLIARGKEAAFIEFGTGVYNESYVAGMSGWYIWDKYPDIVRHGSYGKGHGKRRAWGFYATGGYSLGKYDFYASTTKGTDKTHHYYGDKRLIGTGTPATKKVIITPGLRPARAMYRAVKDMKGEIKK